jgi:hypothetical protein
LFTVTLEREMDFTRLIGDSSQLTQYRWHPSGLLASVPLMEMSEVLSHLPIAKKSCSKGVVGVLELRSPKVRYVPISPIDLKNLG